MNYYLPFFILLLAVGPVSGMPQSKINFQTGDLKELRARAAAEGKPLFVHFTANWCTPCQWMEKNTFSDESLAELVNARFLPVLVDIDDKSGLRAKQEYRVVFLPSMLIFDTRGVVVARYEESMAAPRLYQLLDRQYRELTGAPLTDPGQSGPAATAPPQPEPSVFQPSRIPETAGEAARPAPAQPLRRQTVFSTESTPPAYGIQVGAFSDYENAQRLVKDLEVRVNQPVNVYISRYNDAQVYRILVGVFDSREAAEDFARILEGQAIQGLVKNLNEM